MRNGWTAVIWWSNWHYACVVHRRRSC